MTTPNDRNASGRIGEVRPVDPENAATDPRAAAQQDQIKADHEALEESARRVQSSVPAEVRDTPIQPANVDTAIDEAQLDRDLDAARRHADEVREAARRLHESVPEERDRDRR